MYYRALTFGLSQNKVMPPLLFQALECAPVEYNTNYYRKTLLSTPKKASQKVIYYH